MAYLPDVQPRQVITAQHINAIKNSVNAWVGDTDAKGFTLKNAKFDAASKAAAQTPWAQNIDAAGYSLNNAGLGDFANNLSPDTHYTRAGLIVNAVGRSSGVSAVSSSPRLAFQWAGVASPGQIGLTGTPDGALRTFDYVGTGYVSFAAQNITAQGFLFGSNVTAQLVGYNIYYDGGWKKQQDGPGFAVIKYPGGAASALYTSPTVTGATAPNPTAAMIFRDDGVIEIPRHTHVTSGGSVSVLPNCYFAGNASNADGTWRYIASGGACLLGVNATDKSTRLYAATDGLAGAAISWVNPVVFRTDGVIEIPRHVSVTGLLNASTGQFKGDATAFMTGPGVEAFYLPDGGGEGRVQVYDRPSGGFKMLKLSGAPVNVCHGATEAFRTTANGIAFPSGARLKIDLDGNGLWGSGIEQNASYTQIAAGLNHRWYIGTPDGGVSPKMELRPSALVIGKASAIEGGEIELQDQTCTWQMDVAGGNLRFLKVTGAGPVVPFMIEYNGGRVYISGPLVLNGTPTSPTGLPARSVWIDTAAGNVLKIVP